MSAAPPAGGAGNRATPARASRIFLIAGVFVACVLAGFVSGFASGSPDGLEKVAEQEGFLDSATDHAFAGFPLADYAVAGITDERLAGGLAGIIGVAITFVVGGVVVFVAVRAHRATSRRAQARANRGPDTSATAAADPPTGR